MGNGERKVEPRARPSKLWRVVVAGGMALAAACAGAQKGGDAGASTGSTGASGSSGTSGGMSGGGGGGAGGW